MNRDKITVVARPRRFEPATTNVFAVSPVSPMVLQGLVEITAHQGQKIDILERKLDALVTRFPHEMTVARADTNPRALPEAQAEGDIAIDPPTAPRRRIDRSTLWNLFD